MNLRDYQTRAVTDIRAAFRQHRRVLFQLPTGGGKTVIFTYIANAAVQRGNSVTIVAHRREIVEQISDALTGFRVRHGIIAPGSPQTPDRVQVGMIQTIARRQVSEPRILVVDEAHHSISGSYRTLMERWPNCRVFGVSATPARLDGAPLSNAFDTLVSGPSMRWLIDNGYLAAYDYFAPPPPDLSAIHSIAGDYNVKELGLTMDRAVITGSAVQHYAELLNGLPSVAFCVTVAHAEHVAAQFQAAGFRAAHIDGSMDRPTRGRLLDGLRSGALNVLTSAELISEGVDVPICAGAILLRPTKSTTVFLQQVGRALRVKPDGRRAVILDHVGNSATHGLPDDPRVWSLEGRVKRQGPGTSTCKRCFRTFEAGTSESCGDMQCPIGQGGGTVERAPPAEVEGRLQRVEDRLAWCGGLDIAGARGVEFHTLVERAGDDVERLRMIARARGFKRGWAGHIVKARAARVALFGG